MVVRLLVEVAVDGREVDAGRAGPDSGGQPFGGEVSQCGVCAYSRVSLSARLGTTNDARKSGKNLLPVHRKATISPSAASKV